jgi:hypothetical protein
VTRQRTEREGPDERGQHWTGEYAKGTEATMATAKTEATGALKRHRLAHILGGGDVGYGDAPTGKQIREALVARRSRKASARGRSGRSR